MLEIKKHLLVFFMCWSKTKISVSVFFIKCSFVLVNQGVHLSTWFLLEVVAPAVAEVLEEVVVEQVAEQEEAEEQEGAAEQEEAEEQEEAAEQEGAAEQVEVEREVLEAAEDLVVGVDLVVALAMGCHLVRSGTRQTVQWLDPFRKPNHQIPVVVKGIADSDSFCTLLNESGLNPDCVNANVFANKTAAFPFATNRLKIIGGIMFCPDKDLVWIRESLLIIIV